MASVVRRVRTQLSRDGADYGADTGERMAEWIVGHVLEIEHSDLIVRANELFPPEASAQLESLVARLIEGEPFAYVVGQTDFLDLTLMVGPGALIPRPETEGLAEWAIGRTPSVGQPRVLDVGTGVGPLALSIARARPNAIVHATDRSRIALDLAVSNAERLGLTRSIAWHHTDLLPEGHELYDVVVANLPYVGFDEIALVAPEVLLHEPHEALFAGPDGLALIERLLNRLPDRIAAEAAVGLEIGWRQGPSVVKLARAAFPSARVQLRADLAGRVRYVLIDIDPKGAFDDAPAR